MKSLVRWSATLGLVGSTLLGSSVIGNPRAIALPEAEVVQKLQSIPVFTITDDKGAPLVTSVKDQQNKDVSVAGVFISQQDAQGFVNNVVKTQNPELAKTVQVVPVPLAEVYKLAQANRDKPNALNFDLVPRKQQVDSAVALLRQNGQQAQQFSGVPLFVAKVAQNGKEQGYLTLQQNNQPIIPFFFDKEQLQGMVDQFKKQKPDMAANVKIDVLNLESFIQTLRSNNSPDLKQVMLVPSQESLTFLQSLRPAGGANQPQAPRR